MISLVWTKSDLIGSKLIKWATKSPCSHFAFVFDSRIVFQSTFNHGVHLSWLHNFLVINTVVHRIDLNISYEDEEKIYQKMIQMDDRPYDWRAIIYLGYRFIKHRLFNTPLPSRNKMSSVHADVCVELASVLSAINIKTPPLDIVTPESLYLYLKDKLHDIRINRA